MGQDLQAEMLRPAPAAETISAPSLESSPNLLRMQQHEDDSKGVIQIVDALTCREGVKAGTVLHRSTPLALVGQSGPLLARTCARCYGGPKGTKVYR